MTQMKKASLLLIVLFAAVFTVLAAESARAGGCCLVVSLEDLPQQVVAGEPLTLSFTARINSQKFNTWQGTLTAVHAESGERVQVEVVRADEPGRYTAELVLPLAGEWRWTVNERPLPPLTVQAAAATIETPLPAFDALLMVGVGSVLATAVGLFLWLRRRTPYRLAFVVLAAVVATGGFVLRAAPGAVMAERETAAAAIAPEEMGAALFVAKGCVTCHRHDGVSFTTHMAKIGPDLTHYRGDADFLRRWLSDPKAVRPRTFMPNLELSQAEIETLVVFLQTQ